MRLCVGVALVLVSLVVGSASVAQDADGTQPTKLLKKSSRACRRPTCRRSGC